MPVEVSVISQSGIPEDALFSIRAGSVRRQAALSSGKGYRFPKIGIAESPVKIDLLQNIGTAYIVVKPGEERYQAIFQGKEGEMACELEMRDVDGPAQDEPEVKEPTSDDAKNYLERHHILSFVQAVLQTVIKERPEDPYAHIARHFLCGYHPTDGRSPMHRRTGATFTGFTGGLSAPPKKAADTPAPAPAPEPKPAPAPAAPMPVPEPTPARVGESTLKEPVAAAAAQQVVEISPAPAAEDVEDAAAVEAPAAMAKSATQEMLATQAAPPAAAEAAPAADEDDPLENLRGKMRDTLEDAQQTGKLQGALESVMPAQKAEDPVDVLRTKLQGTFAEAQQDGRLQAALNKSRPETSEGQTAAVDPNDSMRLKLMMRETLESAHTDGTLAETLQRVGEKRAVGPNDSMRLMMRETLESAQRDGTLAKSFQRISEKRAGA